VLLADRHRSPLQLRRITEEHPAAFIASREDDVVRKTRRIAAETALVLNRRSESAADLHSYIDRLDATACSGYGSVSP
jgi:hypothetical protein